MTEKVALNLYQKINLVMKEMSYIKKEGKIGYGNNTYTAVLHDDVTSKLNPLCVKHGLVLIPEMTRTTIERYKIITKKGESERYETQTTVELKVVNSNSPSEYLITSATAHSFDSQDKSCGKAYSMAVKYCYLKLFMIASGDKEEDRVEEEKIVSSEKDKLREILIPLLQKAGKLDSNAINAIAKLDEKTLQDKIEQYS